MEVISFIGKHLDSCTSLYAVMYTSDDFELSDVQVYTIKHNSKKCAYRCCVDAALRAFNSQFTGLKFYTDVEDIAVLRNAAEYIEPPVPYVVMDVAVLGEDLIKRLEHCAEISRSD